MSPSTRFAVAYVVCTYADTSIHIQWYTAFPQIISRVGHQNADIWSMLQKLIRTVIQEYPNQALWKFVAVVKSNQTSRSRRGQAILQKLKVITLYQ